MIDDPMGNDDKKWSDGETKEQARTRMLDRAGRKVPTPVVMPPTFADALALTDVLTDCAAEQHLIIAGDIAMPTADDHRDSRMNACGVLLDVLGAEQYELPVLVGRAELLLALVAACELTVGVSRELSDTLGGIDAADADATLTARVEELRLKVASGAVA